MTDKENCCISNIYAEIVRVAFSLIGQWAVWLSGGDNSDPIMHKNII